MYLRWLIMNQKIRLNNLGTMKQKENKANYKVEIVGSQKRCYPVNLLEVNQKLGFNFIQ